MSANAALARPASEALRTPDYAWPSLALFVGSTSLFIVATVAGARGWWSLPTAMAAAGAATYVAFTLMHEAAHGLISRRRLVNQLVGEVAATLLAGQFNGFRQVHKRHHRYACDPALDTHVFAGLGPRWLRPLRWATYDVHLFMRWNRGIKDPRLESTMSSISLVLVWGTIGALTWAGYLWAIVLLWLLPARIAMTTCLVLTDYLPHQRPYGRPSDQMECSVVLRGGRVADALMLGHSFHLVHHLFPSVPWYRLYGVYAEHRDRWRAVGMREAPLFSGPRADHLPRPGELVSGPAPSAGRSGPSEPPAAEADAAAAT